MDSSRAAAMFHTESGMGEGDAHAHKGNNLSNYLRVRGYQYYGSLASLHSSGASHEVRPS